MDFYTSVKYGIVLAILSTGYSHTAEAQRRRSGGYADKDFLDHQFWIGVRAGGNIAKVNPTERYTIFNATEANVDKSYYDKKYINFKKVGFESGLDFTYFYKGICISVFPSFVRYRYGYTNDYQWQDTANANFRIEQLNTTSQFVDYVKFPICVKYQPQQFKLRPILIVGVYYSAMLTANRRTKIEITDYASGGANAYEPPAIDVTYWRNTHVITNRKERFKDQTVSNNSDVQDDVKLRSLNSALTIAMPLRFILKANAKSEN